MDSIILIASKVVTDVTKIEAFSVTNFKRWQTKLLLVWDIAKIEFVLTKTRPKKPKEDSDLTVYNNELTSWENAN